MNSFKSDLICYSGRCTALTVLSAGRFDFKDVGSNPIWGFAALYAGLFLIIVLPLSVLIGIRVYRTLQLKKQKTYMEDLSRQAAKSEQAGQFVSAAFIYEKLKDLEKAAALYERGGDFGRAAEVYESIGQFSKSKEMSEKAGNPEKAAETCMYVGDYLEAAKIYNQMGDKLRAARALEMSGNRLAAVRAYREAKDYVKASVLLKQEGMLRESADMFKLSLSEKMNSSNLEKYYSYASLLEQASEKEQACDLYRRIACIDPEYMDVREKISEALPAGSERVQPPSRPEPLNRDSTEIRAASLRSLMRSGRMGPRYSLRIWVQVLKALKQNRNLNFFPVSLDPDLIFIDPGNNVTFKSGSGNPAYMAPEVKEGSSPDSISLIYSLGVILYEMLAGGLDSLGDRRIAEVWTDVPLWLDELTMKSIEENRSLRYRSIDEILSALRNMKKQSEQI